MNADISIYEANQFLELWTISRALNLGKKYGTLTV